MAWADLAGHGFIPNGLCDTMALDPVIRLSATARLRARNVAALYGLVEAGLGVTILPTLAAPTEGTLTMVPLVDREATTRIYVFRRKDEVLSPAADRLRTMLLAGL